MFQNISTHTLVSYTLRIGIAFAFLYPAIDSFFHPDTWSGFFPSFVLHIWLVTFGLTLDSLHLLFASMEIAVAAGLLLMKDPFYPALASILVLLAIIILDFSAFAVVFRDVSILLMGVALIFLERERAGYNKSIN